jgi:hypothetical protein
MSDTVKGSPSGYLFQFEKALLLLSQLQDIDGYISIENVDDVATHKANGTVLLTVQAKNSISRSGTAFEDTSYALWRTIQIWIQKLQSNIFNNETQFICSTNKKIPPTSLLYKMKHETIENALALIKDTLKTQQEKLASYQRNSKAGKSISQIITLIEFALSKEAELKIILNKIELNDDEDLKSSFLNEMHLNADDITTTTRDSVFEEFYGWITSNSKAKWNNGNEAKFTKKDFDNKWLTIRSNTSIINAIFRTKESIGTPPSEADISLKRKELFVKQIEDINRKGDVKERKIRSAIQDFIYSEIEIKHIVQKGEFTKEDFEQFLDTCFNHWQEIYDKTVLKEITEYDETELNGLAINIFDSIMHEAEITFKDGFSFTTNSKYILNGSFLNLSNVPKIGWHPNWENKYKK